MKLIKILMFLLVGAMGFSSASGQANAFINVLTLNSGRVNLGGAVYVQVDVGNSGPASIGVNKVRAQISIPAAIGLPLANGLQTGLPPGWTILSNTAAGVITVCNGSDIIPANEVRRVLIAVQGNTIGGPSTVSGVLSFGPGTGVCTGPGSLPGNSTADDASQSTLEVVPAGQCILSVSASAGNIACFGGTTTLTAIPGEPTNVEFSVNGGAFQTSRTFTVPIGIYTVTARRINDNACTATATAVTIIQPTVLTVTAASTAVTTPGGSEGTATATEAGGTGPYTYLWTPGGQTTATATGLTAGSYSVTVTDAKGCTATVTTTVGGGGPVCNLAATATAGTIACFGGTTTLTVTATGGNGAVQYSLNGGAFQAGNTFTVPAGTYTVTAREVSTPTCTATATAITVTQPQAITAPAVGTITQPTCAVATGTVVLNGLPATGTWTLTRTPGAVTTTGTGASTTITGLAAGTYTLTVTNATGCTSAASASVVINNVPVALAAPTTSVIQPTCTVATGTITITSVTAGLTFSLDGGTYVAYPSGGYIVAVGNHTLTAQGAGSCISVSTNVTVNTQPAIPAAPTAGATTQPTCAVSTGSVVLSGLPSGNWTINPGAISGNTTTTTVNGLSQGTYNFTVTNTAGCTSASSATVVINNLPGAPVIPAVSVTQPTCTLATGTITVTSAIAGLTFSLDGGAYTTYPASGYTVATGTHTLTAQNASSCTSPVTTITVDAQPVAPAVPTVSIIQPTCSTVTGIINITSPITGLTFSFDGGTYAVYPAGGYIVAAGVHTLRAQNGSGCISDITTITVNAQLATPATPAVSTITQPTCAIITGAVVLGGLPPGNWTINPGAISGNTTTTIISGLTPGTYNYTVTNSAGCTSGATANVVINNITGIPAAPIVSVIQPTCTSATGTITIISAATGLTFSLDGGAYAAYPSGGYIVAAGDHTLVAQNAGNCISAVTNVAVNTQPAIPAVPVVSVIQPTCSVATGTIAITSSISGLTFSLDGGAYVVYQAGGYIVAAGAHTLTAQNAGGCISAVINITVNAQPESPTASVSPGAIACFNGATTLTVFASGGAPPFQYSLNNGAFQSDNVFTAGAGIYTVTIRDANLCTTTAAAVTVTQPTAITASASAGAFVCNSGTTTLIVTATGGTGTLKYSLNGGAFQSGNTFLVGAGTQTITVRDANLCTATAAAVTVTQPTALAASATARRITQCGGTTQVMVVASGGIAPYTSGVGTFTRGPGTWTFSVTDGAGCTAITDIIIEAPGCMDLKVYPNPVVNSINVNHSIAAPGAIMQVFEINGALVISKPVPQNAFQTTIDVNRLAAGSYVVVYLNGNEKKQLMFEKITSF